MGTKVAIYGFGRIGRNVLRAVVTVYQDGDEVATLYPRRDFYYASMTPATMTFSPSEILGYTQPGF